MLNNVIRRTTRKATRMTMHSDTAARVRFRCSVRSARSSSVSVDRFLPLLRLSDPVFGIAVRFRWFGGSVEGHTEKRLRFFSFLQPYQSVGGTHNPLVPGSSPGGPTTSHRTHGVIALRPGDRSPLVCLIAVAGENPSSHTWNV